MMIRSIVSNSLVLTATLLSAGHAVAQEMTAATLLRDCYESENEAHADVDRALTVFKAGRFSEARSILAAASQVHRDMPPPGLLVAQMFAAAGQQSAANENLQKVAIDHPRDPGAHLIFGDQALAQRRFADADASFRKATQLTRAFKTNDFRKGKLLNRCQLGLALVAEGRENWTEAAKLLRPVADAEPENGTIAGRLARSLFRAGDTDAAFKVLQKHWTSTGEKAQRPEITMGSLFNTAKDKEQSEKLMTLAAERGLDDAVTQMAVANWALENGRTDMAKECSDRALKLTDSSVRARLLAALVARYEANYAKARTYLEEIHLESPANLAAVIELSIVLSHIEGSENLALQYAQVGVKLQPDLRRPAGRSAAVALAWLLHRYGGQAEAQQIVVRTMNAGQIGVESSYFAARILAQQNPKIAKQLLTAVVESGRVFPDFEVAKILLEDANTGP